MSMNPHPKTEEPHPYPRPRMTADEVAAMRRDTNRIVDDWEIGGEAARRRMDRNVVAALDAFEDSAAGTAELEAWLSRVEGATVQRRPEGGAWDVTLPGGELVTVGDALADGPPMPPVLLNPQTRQALDILAEHRRAS